MEPSLQRTASAAELRSRRKFLRFYPGGFRDPDYLEHALLNAGRHEEVAAHAVTIESRTNLLFSFEKMAELFATGLYQWLYGRGDDSLRFARWCETVGQLPRRQTRVLTWPLVTVVGFLALPGQHMFLKPRVTQAAAAAYGFDFEYASKPTWTTYSSLLNFAGRVRRDTRDLRPRDMIDLQSFIWVQGSDEYEE